MTRRRNIVLSEFDAFLRHFLPDEKRARNMWGFFKSDAKRQLIAYNSRGEPAGAIDYKDLKDNPWDVFDAFCKTVRGRWHEQGQPKTS